MKKTFYILLTIILVTFIQTKAQQLYVQLNDVVKDFDGNVYHQIKLGNQVWIKENISSLHYSDGSQIPGVVTYNSDESMAKTFGRLYTWDAAMKNSTQEKAQGVCPTNFHVASDSEWKELENYLGGAAIAGGKMKDVGTSYWKSPNLDATNSSGLGLLPAGEYDAYYSPNQFRLLNEYAVIWTSTQVGVLKARERYITYDKSASMIYDWFKVMKYSVRCVREESATSIDENKNQTPSGFQLNQNYPNPFNPSTTINYQVLSPAYVNISIYDILGNRISTLVNEEKKEGSYNVNWEANKLGLTSGVYYCRMEAGGYSKTNKIVLIK